MDGDWDGTNIIIRLLDKTVYEGECFIYTGDSSCVKDYDAPRITSRNGKKKSVATVSYIELIGPIGKNLFILHKCDRARCWCPSHLYQGTKSQNRQDAINRGRANLLRGENSPSAILTEEQVLDIKRRIRNGASNIPLSRIFNVSSKVISNIRLGLTWRHVS